MTGMFRAVALWARWQLALRRRWTGGVPDDGGPLLDGELHEFAVILQGRRRTAREPACRAGGR
jgi:hypothetical protein